MLPTNIALCAREQTRGQQDTVVAIAIAHATDVDTTAKRAARSAQAVTVTYKWTTLRTSENRGLTVHDSSELYCTCLALEHAL
eukprot:9368-Heterococcus_DN1.PRE.5